MSSCVAILTFRRAHCVKAFLASLLDKAPGYRVAIFEDCGNVDDTFEVLTAGGTFKGVDEELEADIWEHPTHTVFMGRRNQGVAGNSNRAIRWFMRGTEDHLCLCNDDLIATGDFVKTYADAHAFHKIGLWCYCPFNDEAYRGAEIRHKGKVIKLLPRKTGAMMSITRELVDKIGYFEVEMGRFSEEHCGYNVRATLAGFLNINGQPQHCLDIPDQKLAYQDVLSSIYSFERKRLEAFGSEAFSELVQRYSYTMLYRPFKLFHGKFAGGHEYGSGIPVYDLERLGYDLVVDYDLKDTAALA